MATAAGLLMVAGALSAPLPLRATDLQPRTLEAFERYVETVEANQQRQRDDAGRFLYINTLPDSDRRQAWAAIQRGEVWAESPASREAGGRPPHAPDWLINHWVGAVYMPGVSLAQVLAVLQDYDHYQDFFKPLVLRLRLESRTGNDFKISERVRDASPGVTVTLDINSEVEFTQLDAKRVFTRSHSIRIAQVEAADTPREHEYSPGHDSGYMWRLNTYWRLEAQPNGVTAEWESIALSRDIPWLLRWIVRPYVERLARNTVEDMLVATRKAAQSQKRHAP